MEVRLLGPLELVDPSGRPIELRGTKPKALVALLGLRAGEVVSADRIVAELWGEQEIRDPSNAVQVLVSKVRRAVTVGGTPGDRLIVTAGSGYRLDVVPDMVDAVRFEQLSAAGRQLLLDGKVDDAAVTLRAALDLWRGRVLGDLDDDIARGERARLDELRATTLELRIDADLAVGREDEVAAELASLTVEHPWRERLWGQQMLALYRCGRQAEALRTYQTARHVLGEQLGLEPGPELQRLEAAIVAQDPLLDQPGEAARPVAEQARGARTGNLPAATSSFVGRVAELDAVSARVGRHRLVTLVGPGGAGKTRLAVEAAARMGGAHRDGVWLVELGSLRERLEVAPAVATALGLDDAARLEPFLGNKDVLVVVDNCEHLVDEAARVVERLVSAGDGVRVLATSRERLGVAGEVVWVVPPLTPADAAALFVERGQAGGAETIDDDAALVDRICDRLDGLPLAVELAAARTRSLSLSDILGRIGDRFRLLTTGARTAEARQQTLRAVVDWSYELLFSDEQRVFRRLSVFAGGFDLAAAEAVCAGEEVAVGDIVDIIGRLVDKSLVTVTSRTDTTRYALLQTLVDYGSERLQEAGEDSATRDRHLAWMVGFAAAAEPGLRGPDQTRWTRRLGVELDNARAALEWARQRDRVSDAVALAAGLAYGWYITGTVQEGAAFIGQALALEGEASPEQRAVAGAWGAWLIQIGSGATVDAVECAEQAVAIARGRSVRGFCTGAIVAALLRAYRGRTLEAAELIDEATDVLAGEPDRWLRAFLDWVASGLALKVGDAERAATLLRASVARFGAEGDRYGQAIASIRLGELAELAGDYDEATALTTFAYEATTATGPGANASILATRLGNLAAVQGRFDDASTWHATALSRARELGFPGPAAQALSGMGVAAALQDHLDDAERLHREALAGYQAVGSVEGAGFSYAWLGFLASTGGDAPAATELHGRSLARAAAGSERRAMAVAVLGLAGARASAGDADEAARLCGVAAELRGAGVVMHPWLESQRAGVEASARAAIGDGAYEAAHALGRQEADTIVARLVAEAAPLDA